MVLLCAYVIALFLLAVSEGTELIGKECHLIELIDRDHKVSYYCEEYDSMEVIFVDDPPVDESFIKIWGNMVSENTGFEMNDFFIIVEAWESVRQIKRAPVQQYNLDGERKIAMIFLAYGDGDIPSDTDVDNGVGTVWGVTQTGDPHPYYNSLSAQRRFTECSNGRANFTDVEFYVVRLPSYNFSTVSCAMRNLWFTEAEQVVNITRSDYRHIVYWLPAGSICNILGTGSRCTGGCASGQVLLNPSDMIVWGMSWVIILAWGMLLLLEVKNIPI
eukprot:Lithocolla_globosa_v1_NODE_70_length_7053_cov_4.426408.p4 type:complete len:274 gc:universal NODE_70_length_7053_cov_4.426408:4043-4864(+)